MKLTSPNPRALFLLWFAFTGYLHSAHAEVRVAKMISDHAVLQRGVPIHIWGWASPGAKLVVQLHQQKTSAVTDRLGKWNAWLMPEAAGGPYTMSVEGDTKEGRVTVSDLLIGDVWLASGQSNMQMPLAGWPSMGALVKNADAEIKAATVPQLRMLLLDQKSSDLPVDDVAATWTLCTPEAAQKFSAVAYFFGRAILADQHVPIGLIDASWGGTPADSWVSLEGLSSDGSLLSSFANRARLEHGLTDRDRINAANLRETEEAKAQGKPAPTFDWIPDGPAWQPAGIYNGMIAPMRPYSIKGFLWYQGESDSGPERAPYYNRVFEALIRDWRSQFAQGDLPFLYVQISNFKWRDSWGMVRDAQRRALDLRNTAMAVTLDIGDAHNIHPPDKQSVAARLTLAARGMVYGEDVAYQSPLFRQATAMPGAMRVWFDHAWGLNTREAALQGFEVAGNDRVFVTAEASIDGETVIVKAATIAAPQYVRYAFAGVAPPGLYNAAGLPASTFSSEDNEEVTTK